MAGVQDVVICAGEGRGAGVVMSQAQGEDHNFRTLGANKDPA